MSQALLFSSARVAHRLLVRQLHCSASRTPSRIPFGGRVRTPYQPISPVFSPPANTRVAHLLNRRKLTGGSQAMASAQPVLLEPESLPNVAVTGTDPLAWSGDLLVIAVTEEDFKTEGEVVRIKGEALTALNQTLGGALQDIIEPGGFDGKQGSPSRVVRLGSATPAKYVAMIGLGKSEKAVIIPEWGPSTYQALGTALATMAKTNKVKTVGLMFNSPFSKAPAPDAVGKVATGILLGGFDSTRFKSKKPKDASRLTSVEFLLGEDSKLDFGPAMTKAQAVARGTMLTRYLVEAPPNVCTPTHLAEAAAHVAAKNPECFKLEVLEREQCEAMKMGCYLGVSEASDHPPKFIHLTYTPKGEVKKKIAVVGKGLTFDSGGYNIKAGAGSLIEVMKFDMGGSGATLGAARIVGALEPEGVEVHFIIAACENMIDGKGLRPGDVLTSANGKTVEVNNTDAEGRLTLADALWFAQEKCGAKTIVDIATLTGACIVALGPEIGGLYSPSEAMAQSVTAAAKAAGEKVWRMPMEQGYFEQFKSSVADMKNAGGRFGGSITAALFLKEFINEGVEWAHLDIAGPVWDWKGELPTGYAANTLAEWVLSQAQ